MSSHPWVDVSISVRNGMHGWPGNPPAVITMHMGTAKGDVCNVSAVHFNTHTGTHMDAPLHFLHGGRTMDDLPWDAVIGPARVVEIHDEVAIQRTELEKIGPCRGERLLFKTRNSELSWAKPEFDKDFVYISKGAAEYLVECGVQTVGIDYLSVGGFYQDGIETHNVLLGADVWIIEGLDLSRIDAGSYDLLRLPIKFHQGDGAPARCLLRRQGP